MWQSNWKVQASALFLCQGKRSVGQGILEHEIRVPRCFWGKIWSLGNKKEFAAHESLMDSGKTIDFHLSHLMFPPSYGWKDLFNFTCVFWVTNLGFLFDGLGNPGVSSLAKRYGSGWASSWVGILHLYIIQFKSRLVKAWLEICQSPQLTTENALEKLTLMSMTQSVFFWHVNLSMMPAESQGCSHWGHVSTVWSIYVMLGYIPMVPMISTWKNYMYLKQWSHQSHDTMMLSKDRQFSWWDVIESSL